MADISAIKLPNNTTLNFKDSSALAQLQFTGHELLGVTRNGTTQAYDLGEFDTLSVTDLNAGNLIVTGAARFTNAMYGNLAGNAETATTLATGRTIQTNLASTSAATFDGSANITPGITGTLGVGNGGTGQTSAVNAANSFINALTTGDSTPQDNDYYISQYVGGGTSNTTYYRRKHSALWNYIGSKISSDLGLTAAQYNGKAVTSGSADTADKLSSGVNITVGAKTNSFDGSSAISFPASEIGMHHDDLIPTATATYTGILGSASNNAAEDSFYFMSVKPDTFYCHWTLRYRITATIPNQTNYSASSDVILYGYGQAVTPGYQIYNNIYNTSYRPYYLHNFYRLTQAGFNAGYGNAVGIGLRSSNSRNTAGYERTITVEILETYNCTATLLDTPVKWASWTGTGTTNYAGLTEYNGYDNGLCELGDANSNTYDRRYLGTVQLSAGTNGIKAYSIIMQDADGRWQSLTTTTGNNVTHTKNSSAFRLGTILGYNYSNNIAANALCSNNYVYETCSVDFRYSSNCGSTLISRKSVYIVGTMNNGYFYLDDDWYSQDLPTTNDGKVYIYFGEAYSTYQVTYTATHPAYYFDGHLRMYGGDGGYTFTGGTNKITVKEFGVPNSYDITITPSITNNITGSGTNGYLTKFNGANTITNGPQLGSSTTTFLRNDGTWATPVGTTYTAATAAPDAIATTGKAGTSTNYARQDHTHAISLATGDSDGQIKIAGSNVSVKGLKSAAYTESTAYATAAQGTLATNAMPKSGGTFTGAVTLNADPTANLGAATKQYVDTQITNHIAASDAMVFKGTIGTGGTATSLPTSNVVVGDTYKCISAISLTAAQSYTGAAVSTKVGDLIVAMNGSKWIVVPSGDETVTTIKYSTTTQTLTTSAQSGAITVGEAATKQVVTSIDTSAKLPTANAVKTFVEGKNYVPTSGTGATGTWGISISGNAATATTATTATSANKANITTTANAIAKYSDTSGTFGEGPAFGSSTTTYLRNDGSWETPTDTKYTAGTGLSLSTANAFSLSSSGVTAGSAGPTAAVTGSEGTTVAIPRITVDQYGRVTALTSYNLTNKNTTYTAATAAPGKVATASSVGTSTNYARQDHTHGIDLASGDANGQVKIAGTNVGVTGLKSAAYTESSAYATAAQGTLATNALPKSGGTMTGGITMANDSSGWNTKGIIFSSGSRIGENTSGGLGIYAAEKLYLRPNSGTAASSTDGVIIDGTGLYPSVTNTENLGGTSNKWANIYSTAGTFSGAVTGASFGASGYLAANTSNSGTAGGIALYGTTPTQYGIAMRNISNGGKHGYVNNDWATYFYMQGTSAANSNTRGWIFKNTTNGNAASISGAGNAVFNGSVTVGGNVNNDSGMRMEYDATLGCTNFIFN